MARDDRAVDHGAVAQARDPRLAVESRSDLAPVDLLDAIELVFRDTELGQETLGALGRIVRGLAANRGAALGDRAMEQPARRRHRHHRRGLTAAAGLAEDRHAIRIAAEALDVVAHPLERRDQVLHADVGCARPFLAAQAGKMQEAKEVEAVIDGDDDDILFLREIRAVVEQVVTGAGREAAAVHPHHDRAALGCRGPA